MACAEMIIKKVIIMKKTILALLLAAAMLTPLPAYAEDAAAAPEAEAPAAAEETPADPVAAMYNYGLDNEGNAELYDFLPKQSFVGELVIPSEIDGHPVDYVGNGCYMEAYGITSVVIPATLADMGESVFFGCSSIERFEVEAGNPYFSATADGVLLADDGALLVAYPAASPAEMYTVPASVQEIGGGAFGFLQNLKSVEVPDGTAYIDTWAFAHAPSLETITIAGSVTTIDSYAFAYDDSLRSVTLNSGLTEIMHAAFAYDGALTQITLPPTLTKIGQYAFCGTGLTCVTIPRSLSDISYCAFGYDADMHEIPNFTIYGEPYTAAQTYAADTDPENGYENHFEFVAVEDADIPYELGGGKLLSEAEDESAAAADSADALAADAGSDDAVLDHVDSAADPAGEASQGSLWQRIGAALKGNPRLQVIIGIACGVLFVLAAVLLFAFLRKPKSAKKDAPAKDDSKDAPKGDSKDDAKTPDAPADDATEEKDG